MNQLINITENNGNKAVSARELHEFLIKDAKGGQIGEQFNHWIQRKLEYGYQHGIDYTIIEYDYLGNEINSQSNNQDVRVYKRDYILTIDTAKEMAMTQNNDKGKQARRYFIAVEKKVRQAKTEMPKLSKFDQKRQLIELIRANLKKGDVKQVATELEVPYNTLKNVMRYNNFTPRLVHGLYARALDNKKTALPINEMINQLKF